MSKQSISSAVGIVVLVALVLAGCAVPATPPDSPSASRSAGVTAPGDTSVTNLVADGDVSVGGNLSVSSTCTGCGGASHIKYVALVNQVDEDHVASTVSENPAGLRVVWRLSNPGQYDAVLMMPIGYPGWSWVDPAKAACFIGQSDMGNYPLFSCWIGADPIVDGPNAGKPSNSQLHVAAYSVSEQTFEPDFANVPLEIRVYP